MIFRISQPLIRLGLRRATFPPRGRLFIMGFSERQKKTHAPEGKAFYQGSLWERELPRERVRDCIDCSSKARNHCYSFFNLQLSVFSYARVPSGMRASFFDSDTTFQQICRGGSLRSCKPNHRFGQLLKGTPLQFRHAYIYAKQYAKKSVAVPQKPADPAVFRRIKPPAPRHFNARSELYKNVTEMLQKTLIFFIIMIE